MQRRTFLKTAVWTSPVVSIATAAPAFATSGVANKCDATGWYKDPGLGHATKDYHVLVECSSEEVNSVQIYDDVKDTWLVAEKQGDGSWAAFGFNDSRRSRKVMINGSHILTVAFPPWNS